MYMCRGDEQQTRTERARGRGQGRIFKFLSLLIYTAIVSLPSIQDYWVQYHIFESFPGSVMSGDILGRYCGTWKRKMSKMAVDERMVAHYMMNKTFLCCNLLTSFQQLCTSCTVRSAAHSRQSIC